MSSYIFKTTPNGAKVKMTLGIGRDVSKQTMTLTRTRRHFPVLLSCISCENLHYYLRICFLKVTHQRYTIFDYRLCNLYSKTDTTDIILHIFSIAVDDKMAAKLFFSQNESSSSERDSLTPCNMHLTPCNMQKILHGYSCTKSMGIFLGI